MGERGGGRQTEHLLEIYYCYKTVLQRGGGVGSGG